MSSESEPDEWINQACVLPVAFAQVREDSLLDSEVLQRIGHNNLVCLMIASGGCTAAALVASNRLSALHLVDMNPAQLALCRLKLDLLASATPLERRQWLGHADLVNRGYLLKGYFAGRGLSENALGPMATIEAVGPDYAGRYEMLFARLRSAMAAFEHEWISILSSPDSKDRSARVAPETELGRAMDKAFDQTMSLPNLVGLFGSAATQNSVDTFSRHFARRTRRAIASLPTADNPYLWQLLLGRFPERVAYPWMDAVPPVRMPEITESVGTMDHALMQFRDHFDWVHLSNILDWLSVEQARQTLELAHRALKPGGCVLIRQLNSSLNIRQLMHRFDWQVEVSDQLFARDRSFFYRELHLGKKI